jgi:hypothetical protein
MTGVAELAIAAYGVWSQSAEVTYPSEQVLPVCFPIEHHLVTASLKR